MLLSDWYEANKDRLAADGFVVDFSIFEDAQALRATGDAVAFDFLAKGHLYADFFVCADDGQEKLGRVDNPPDVASNFEDDYRGEVLTRIST